MREALAGEDGINEDRRMEDLENELAKKDLASLISFGRDLKRKDPANPDVLRSYRAIGTVLIDRAEPLLAFPLIDQALGTFPKDDRLRQLLGLAFARSGASTAAHRVLDGLYQEELDRAPETSTQAVIGREETLSMLARVFKDFGLESWPVHRAAAIRHWEKSLQLYSAAYSLRMNYFPGINAAAVATMLGRHDAAKHIADDVRKQTFGLLDCIHAGQATGDLYWINATLGEAFLIAKDLPQAENCYAEATKIGLAGRVFGKMGSTARQLKFLLPFLDFDASVADQLFPMPRVGICAGHMVDLPGRAPARFPESAVPRVSEEIRAWLEREDIRIGFSSGACGADLLFLEALLEKGGEAHMILPFEQEAFCQTSVAVGGANWVKCYERVLDRSMVKTISERPLKLGEVAYDHANQIIHGLAILHADRLSASLRRLAVWNGEEAAGLGGTGDVVYYWHRLAQPIDVLEVPDVQPARPLEQVVLAAPRIRRRG